MSESQDLCHQLSNYPAYTTTCETTMPPARALSTCLRLRVTSVVQPCRSLTTSPRLRAEGDTGALRTGGSAHSDAFTKREKAAEDMWIRDREKNVIAMLRDKIARQEALLEEDRRMLAKMEDQYGHVAEREG